MSDPWAQLFLAMSVSLVQYTVWVVEAQLSVSLPLRVMEMLWASFHLPRRMFLAVVKQLV
jgi:hypothetical protein